MSEFWVPGRFQYVKQAIATLNQDPPVATTWYTVLDTTFNARLKFIAVRRLDDDANAKNVQLRVTADGIALNSGNVALADNTWYYGYLVRDMDAVYLQAAVVNVAQYTDFRAHEVLVELMQNAVPGANAQLDGRVQYATLEPG